MLPTTDDGCDDCRPRGTTMLPSAAVVWSSIPFILTYLVVAIFVFQKLYPSLAGESISVKANGFFRSLSGAGSTQSRSTIKQISAITFASTIALAAVLTLLILCEISNSIDPIARDAALQTTISLLLILLIIAIPLLEIRSLITGTGQDSTGRSQRRVRLTWILETLFFSVWLLGFWWSGKILPGQGTTESPAVSSTSTFQSIGEGSLRRIGVIGISVMSSLSGFASVSSAWYTFFTRHRPVSETDVTRRIVGLQYAQELLAEKQSRLDVVSRKLAEPATSSYIHRAFGNLRGNPDSNERNELNLEISGLETMCADLSASLSAAQVRFNTQHASRTFTGQLYLNFARAFALFCCYRIFTTTVSFLRRRFTSSTPPPDPVDNILALLAKHYDPNLDQALWARSISFLLSGIILFASFSSVMQTFHFFSRFAPGLLRTIQANLALVVAQVCATYVISAALMLRSMVPGGVVGDGLRGLGGGVGRMGWVDGWFEVWFLGGVGVTAVGFWVGRQVGNSEEDEGWDDEGMGKGGMEGGKWS